MRLERAPPQGARRQSKEDVMRSPWVVLTGLSVVVHGCASPDSPLESVGQPIIAGTVNTGDPAIMSLLSFKGNLGARCTATLVTPRLLLAAAHCLTETPGFERWVYPGNDDRNVQEKDLLRPQAVVANPRYGSPRQGHDFSIIVLETPLAIRPVPINRAPIEKALGKNVRYVGYGLTRVGDFNSGGVKRHNTAPLAQVGGLLLTIAPNAHGACQGDSGGPLLYDDGQGESIIGIGSFVSNPPCLRESFYQRVDTQLAWIDEQIQKYDPGGLAPPADGGASDAAAAPTADAAAPDASAPPAPDAAVSPPGAEPPRDARARDVARVSQGDPEPEPEPEETNAASGTGGCSHAGRAPGAGGVAIAALLFTLAWARCKGRRRSRRDVV
jgi:hypothetical protein